MYRSWRGWKEDLHSITSHCKTFWMYAHILYNFQILTFIWRGKSVKIMCSTTKWGFEKYVFNKGNAKLNNLILTLQEVHQWRNGWLPVTIYSSVNSIVNYKSDHFSKRELNMQPLPIEVMNPSCSMNPLRTILDILSGSRNSKLAQPTKWSLQIQFQCAWRGLSI